MSLIHQPPAYYQPWNQERGGNWTHFHKIVCAKNTLSKIQLQYFDKTIYDVCSMYMREKTHIGFLGLRVHKCAHQTLHKPCRSSLQPFSLVRDLNCKIVVGERLGHLLNPRYKRRRILLGHHKMAMISIKYLSCRPKSNSFVILTFKKWQQVWVLSSDGEQNYRNFLLDLRSNMWIIIVRGQ